MTPSDVLEQEITRLSEAEWAITDNERDRMKISILKRLYKNLSLEQLDNLEITAENNMRSAGQKYISIDKNI